MRLPTNRNAARAFGIGHGWLPAICITLASVTSSGCEGVTQEEYATIEAWLTCDECEHGERDSVRAIGKYAVPLLKEALATSSPYEMDETLRAVMLARLPEHFSSMDNPVSYTE